MSSLPLTLASTISDLDALLFGSNGHKLFNSGLNEIKPFITSALGKIPMNVYETDSRVVVVAQLPGINKADINLTINGLNLTIATQRPPDDQTYQYHLTEFLYGKIERTILLPAVTDTEKVDAAMENGLLKVAFSKRSDKASGKITIV